MKTRFFLDISGPLDGSQVLVVSALSASGNGKKAKDKAMSCDPIIRSPLSLGLLPDTRVWDPTLQGS